MPPRLPRSERRRPRPGSLERPVNSRMYRGTWLLVGIPLLVAAFSVARPEPLPAPPLPATFDGETAEALAADLARDFPDRSPGSPGALGAAEWISERFRPYGFTTETQAFTGTIPGRGRVRLRNVLARAVGRSPDVIVVMAHRDDTGENPGANDNASGTAALVELARTYARARAGGGCESARSVCPTHTIVFLSTDGDAFGALGAARFAASAEYRSRILAVINLDAIASPAPARIVLAGDRPRSPPASLVQTASERVLEQTGALPARASALRQLLDLAFPFSLYGQAPFVARGVPAITLTTVGDRPSDSFGDSERSLDRRRLEQLGRSAQGLLGSLDQGLELEPGPSSHVFFGRRAMPGWAIELVLIASLLPFLAATVDLFARCRRRRIPLASALRAYRSRAGLWLFVGACFGLLTLADAWPNDPARPISPDTAAAGSWPVVGIALLTVASVLAWLVCRERLLPRRTLHASEEIAGYTASLLVLAVIALLVIATNPFALVFLLPSLHAWLWLPQVRWRGIAVRLAVLALGLAGPLLLLGSFASRLGLGLDVPWYLAALVAVGYVPLPTVLVFLAWVAAAAQLGALASGRYAPYPDAAERPPRGPVRALVRRTARALRARRRDVPEQEAEALHA